MKMMDITLTFILMLNTLSTKPVHLPKPHRTKRSSCLESFGVKTSHHHLHNLESRSSPEQHLTQHHLAGQLNQAAALEPHSQDFINRFKRSSPMRRRRKQQLRREEGCVLRQVQVKVSELGLGYMSQEELVFRYCSGICSDSLTNYDKILSSLAARGRRVLQGSPPTACCRPIAYDDNLSFLDDSLLYHTVKKHSAKKCGCV